VLLLGLVQNAINLLNVPPNYDYVVSGLVIALAASVDVFRRNFAEAALRRRSARVKQEQAGSAPKPA
jgi:ribose transport system permease protein